MQDKTVRCDKCAAEAWVVVHYAPTDKILSFCGHDYHELSKALAVAGWIVVEDERETINVRPSVSANV